MSDTPVEAGEAPPPILVTAPAEGLPPIVDTHDALDRTLDALAAGSGPVAVDTERAQGFRYTGKAYLIQIRRTGSGTHLIDPLAFEGGRERANLSHLREATGDAEWIIHAATQDLGCLDEVGLAPERLFDTELAGRLLGLPRVSLGALTETALGKALRKEHSAADWSRRPLPEDWLTYAALDVELLVDLRDWAAEELRSAGKEAWAAEEFAHLAAHAGDYPPRRDDPWRRTTGIHDVRSSLGLAYVRELWLARDAVARSLDRAPGRLLGDRAITELAAKADPRTTPRLDRTHLATVKGFSWRAAARYQLTWLDALDRAASIPRADLPPLRLPAEGPPQPRSWAPRHPEAAARWERVRPAMLGLAEDLHLPVENLLSPDALRRLAWDPPAVLSEQAVDAFLEALDARAWQRGLVVPVLTPLLG